MPYINTKYLFKCETCRHFIAGHGCNTFCESGECYSPNMNKIPTADVAPRAEVAREIIDDLASAGLLNVEPWGIENLKKEYTGGETRNEILS